MTVRRDEYQRGGIVYAVDVWDLQAGTFRREERGQVVEERPLTAEEVARLTPPPDPRADLRARIAAAESPAELQSLLLQLLDMGA